MMRIMPSVIKPQFKARLELSEEAVAGTLVSSASSSSVAVAGVGGVTGTVGSALQTGGTGLMSSGPQSSAANTVLGHMQTLGSGPAAVWSAQNPALGGLAQIAIGSALDGVGGGAAGSTRRKSKSPS